MGRRREGWSRNHDKERRLILSTISHSRNSEIAADQALLAGVQKFLMSYPSLSVDGQTMTPANIVQFLQNRIQASQAAQTAEAARTAALKTETDVRAETAAQQQSLRQIVLGMYSGSPDNLAVFGLKPHKASSETATTRAAAAVKAKATRKARGTLGPKQKLEITGSSTPETPTPPKT
jgi:hypothetical protein